MKTHPRWIGLLVAMMTLPAAAQDPVVLSLHNNGMLTWSNSIVPSRYSIEWASSPTGTWVNSWNDLANQMSTDSVARVHVPMFYRVVCNTNPFANDLVAYYPFSGTAMDASGNYNTGTVIEASFAEDRKAASESAVLFTNDGHRIRIPDSPGLDLTTQLTLCAWVRLDGVRSDFQEIIAKWYDNGSSSWSYELAVPENSAAPAFVLVVGGRQVLSSSEALTTGQWTFVVGTFDGSKANIYVNGKQRGEAAWPGVVNQGTAPLMIGAHDSASDRNQFYGAIDEVRIYNRALNSNEVEQLHQFGP
jgi:hypothetical protein